jgi:hypothetical protein
MELGGWFVASYGKDREPHALQENQGFFTAFYDYDCWHTWLWPFVVKTNQSMRTRWLTLPLGISGHFLFPMGCSLRLLERHLGLPVRTLKGLLRSVRNNLLGAVVVIMVGFCSETACSHEIRATVGITIWLEEIMLGQELIACSQVGMSFDCRQCWGTVDQVDIQVVPTLLRLSLLSVKAECYSTGTSDIF